MDGVNLDDYFPPIEYDDLPWPDIGEDGEFNGFGWRNLLTAPHPWDESRRPHINPLDYEDVKIDYEKLFTDGYLTRMICAKEISNLDVIPGTVHYGLTKIQLAARNIKNINILQKYKMLQYVDVSYNKISDVTVLSKMKHLIVFDISHNKLSYFKCSPPPLFLSYLNLSSNRFYRMPNFNYFWSLKHLNLSYNNIERIEGIDQLIFLRYLNLSHNAIVKIKQLTNVSLKELDISHNYVRYWEDLPDSSPNCLYSLKVLNAAHNEIESLKVFRNAYNLEVLNLSFNKISEVAELDNIVYLRSIKKLFLNGNKVSTRIKDFRCLCAYILENLEELNGVPVTAGEKVSSLFTYSDNLLVDEIVKQIRFMVLNNSIGPLPFGKPVSFIPNNSSIVILIGTAGAYNKHISQMIANKHSAYVKLVKIHTTMPPPNDSVTIGHEDHSANFIHVSPQKFENMIRDGEVFYEHVLEEFRYGVAVSELESDGRITMLATSLICGLNLFWAGYNPMLFLIRTANNDLCIRRIKQFYKQIQTLASSGTKAEISANQSVNEGLFINLNRDSESETNPYEEKLEYRGKKMFGSIRKSTENDEKEPKDFGSIKQQPTVTFKNPKRKKTDSGIEGEVLDPNLHLMCNSGSRNYYVKEETFVRAMLMARDRYLQLHREMPGLFLMMVESDNLYRAYRKIVRIIKNEYNSKKPPVNTEFKKKCKAYDDLVQVHVNKMIESILNQNNPLRTTTD